VYAASSVRVGGVVGRRAAVSITQLSVCASRGRLVARAWMARAVKFILVDVTFSGQARWAERPEHKYGVRARG
jgi:hypothetical protein